MVSEPIVAVISECLMRDGSLVEHWLVSQGRIACGLVPPVSFAGCGSGNACGGVRSG
jgi:hypothetical protein